MLFTDITILDEKLEVQSHQYVGIKDGLIACISSALPAEDYGEHYDGRGKLLMTGLFNMHAHSPMSLMRGYAEGYSLQDWLNLNIFPFEDQLTGQDAYYATLLSMAESLRMGIVSSSDMYFFVDEMAQAILESGVKNNLSRSLLSFDDQELQDMTRFHEARSLWENFHLAGEGRLRVDMSIHAEYSCTDKLATQLGEYCQQEGAGFHVHISETQSEHEACKARHGGLTPVQYFAQAGLFEVPSYAAHCVWLEPADIELLAEKKVTVTSCPVSNMKLASGACNVPRLLAAGVNVALGTDSVASNNSLCMFEEMKFFALLPKLMQQDPALLSPRQALYAATRAGALAQGRPDCGQLKVGHKADLIVLDFNQPHLQPVYDYANHLVYSASGRDVCLTMVDGKVLYKDGQYLTIDIEKVMAEVEHSRQRILRKLSE